MSFKLYKNSNLIPSKTCVKDIKILLIKKKTKKQQYGRKRYKNLSEDEKKGQLSIEKDIMNCEKIKICFKHLKWNLTFFKVWCPLRV